MRKNRIVILCVNLGLISFTNSARAQDRQASAVQDSQIQSTAGERVMEFYAIHRQTGEPLGDVNLTVRVATDNYNKQESWDDKTDSQGACRIKLPDFQIQTLRLYPRKEGFVPLFIMWRGIPTPPELPDVFTIAMEPSTTIGGVVRNERGEPIEGVAVGVYYRMDDPDAAENAHVEILIFNTIDTDIKTDETGRWTFDKMPSEIDKNELRIFLTHPGYISDNLRPSHIPLPITRQPSIESLRDLSAVMVMNAGLEVSGRVTDKRGNPIAGAKIYDTEGYWWRSSKPFAETDTRGQYQANTKPGAAIWTVQATGYAPDLKVMSIVAGMPPVEIRLEPGRIIVGRVTDQTGKPVEGARISAEMWRKNRRRLHLEAQTDAEGKFKVTDAPADEVTFDIGQQGYMMLENYPMKPGKDQYTITLRPTLKVCGTVLDAQTGQTVDKFTVTNGFDREDGRAPQWDKYSVRTFTNSQYEMEYRQEIFTYRIRIDAEGYQSAVSDCIRPSEIRQSNIIRDFKLDKAAAVTVLVQSPDGRPLTGADVVIATHGLRIVNGRIDSRSSERNLILQTNANGRFHFVPPVSPYAIVVLSEQGFAKIMPQEFKASRTITLSAWGRIEGTLRIGVQPGADKLIAFLPESRRGTEHPRISFEYEVQTDKDGHFAFAHVLPGEGIVTRAIPIGDRARRMSHSFSIEVKPGQTNRVQIGGTGRPVIGRVIVPDMIKDKFDWQYTNHRLRVSSFNSTYKIITLEFDEDGSFRAEDVPAGDYCVYLTAYGPPPDSRSRWGERIGVLTHPFNIPEMSGGRSDEPLDLGDLELGVIGKSALIKSLVGKPLPDLGRMKVNLAPTQAKGNMILVCFWDMNQRPSRRCISRLAEQAGQLKQKGVIIVAVQASKVDEEKLNEWVKRNNIPFPVGTIQGDPEKTRFNWGVKSLPWLILTDNKHVVVSEGFQFGDLGNQLERAGREKS